MFSIATYGERRRLLCQRVRSGLILLPGNDESPMNYADNTYPFRQDSSFLYYFGLDRPGLAAVIDAETMEATMFGDELTIDDIVWMGNQPTLTETSRLAGVDRTAPTGDLPGILARARAAGRTVHFLPPYRPENKIKLWQWLGIAPTDLTGAASLDLVRAVVDQRNHKSAEEIAEIDRAVSLSVDMHVAAMTMARPGMKEHEICAEIERVAAAAGGRTSFPVILTINGQTLHNHYHGHTLKEGDMVLCDAGAETEMHYCGDLSSTFPAGTRFRSEQKEIYAVTLAAHRAAVAELRPGNPFRAAHLAACRTIAAGMKEMGFLKGNIDDAVSAGAHAMFFPCGTGHMMGLDVHDMEDIGEIWVGYDGEPKSTQFGLKSLRLARPLEPGFVLTVEPGIYFIPELIDKWRREGHCREFLDFDRLDTFRGFGGIRNEENYLITAAGHRRLGKPKPMEIAEVEALRR